MTKANKAKTGLGFLMYSTDTTTADLSVSSTVVCSVSWQCFVSWQRPLKADRGLFFINQLCHMIPKEEVQSLFCKKQDRQTVAAIRFSRSMAKNGRAISGWFFSVELNTVLFM